jgi:hypothetical protein
MNTHRVFLIGGTENEVAELTESEVSGQCVLLCKYRDKLIEASADDFFDALCAIRLQLERDGLVPFCYGASLNVFPSRMSREMALGKAAYRMTEGKQALRSDLVKIFDEGPDVIPSSVQNQREYFDSWIRSLG